MGQSLDDDAGRGRPPSATDRSMRAMLSVVGDLSGEVTEQALVRSTLQHVIEALGVPGGATFLARPGVEPELAERWGMPPASAKSLEELSAAVFRWGRPVVRDLAEDGWAAGAPLAARDELLGAITLHGGSADPIPGEELLAALGAQIGAGLALARLFAQLRTAVERTELVKRVGLALGAGVEPQAGIAELARELASVVAFDRLAWAFVSETGDYLEVLGHPEASSWGLGSVMPIVGSGPGFVALNEKAVLEVDLLHSRRFIEDMRLLDEGIRSYVLLPLRARGGRSIGVLCLGACQAQGYDEASLARLQPLADSLALALENLRLFQKTKELSITDELTPLYNIRFFRQAADREIKLCDRYGGQLSVVFLDLDRFKPINDTWGHLRGSRVLREVGFLLRSAVRDTDYPARYGGDEFIVLLPQTDPDAAAQLGERLQRTLERHVFLQEEGINVRIGASVGCATYPTEAQNRDALIRLADERMYQSKAERKGAVD